MEHWNTCFQVFRDGLSSAVLFSAQLSAASDHNAQQRWDLEAVAGFGSDIADCLTRTQIF
jgi:hypothetical protein